MKNLFSFLTKLFIFLLAVSTALVGIGYFLNKKTLFFRNRFTKKIDVDTEE